MFTYTYTQNIEKAGSTVTPGWSLFDNLTTKFTFTITAPADIGVYSITSIATIPQVDPVTSANKFVSNNFTLTVQSDCVNTTITDKTITDMSVLVSQSSTQDVTFLDSIATGHA